MKLHDVAVTAPIAGGGWLGVGPAHLVVFVGEDRQLERAWTDTESAQWDGASRKLTVRWVDGAEPLEVELASDDVEGAVTSLRERITASQVHVEIRKTTGGDIRAFIRRGADGEIFSQLVVRGALEDSDQAVATELEQRARAAVGLA